MEIECECGNRVMTKRVADEPMSRLIPPIKCEGCGRYWQEAGVPFYQSGAGESIIQRMERRA